MIDDAANDDTDDADDRWRPEKLGFFIVVYFDAHTKFSVVSLLGWAAIPQLKANGLRNHTTNSQSPPTWDN